MKSGVKIKTRVTQWEKRLGLETGVRKQNDDL